MPFQGVHMPRRLRIFQKMRQAILLNASAKFKPKFKREREQYVLQYIKENTKGRK